jgi:glyoxylate reductase
MTTAVDREGDVDRVAPTGKPPVHISGAVSAGIRRRLARLFELRDVPEGARGILALTSTLVDERYLDAVGAQLRVIANFGVGVDNIDLDAARRRNVVVANTPDVLTHATAELTVTVLLSLLRRVTEGDRLLRREGRWPASMDFMLGESVRDRVVGIVGPGRIGRETARLLESLGAHVEFSGRGDPMEPFLGAVDVVLLHCPLTEETRHLMNDDAFRWMRPGSVLVNAARGALVDERALVRALRSEHLAGAALDVFESEPEVAADLLTFENVVLTPHLGSATRRTREAMGGLAASALRAVLLEGRMPPNRVAP